MRILQINSHYNQGGAARIAACIHRQLSEEGVASYVAYGRGRKSEEKNTIRFESVPEIYFSAFCSRIFGLNGWWNRLATKRLLKYIEKVKPDVIHLHVLHGYYLHFSTLFSYMNEKKIPCVWTFHDCHAFSGNCGYFFDCEKWKNGCGSCPNLHGYPTSSFFDFTAYMWKKKKEFFTVGDKKVIVTPSEWLTGEAKKSFFGKYPCITVHNGIDVKHTFYPRDRKMCRKKYGYEPDEKLILGIAVGFSDPRKGAKYIIRMAEALAEEAKVILVGWEKQNDVLLENVKNVIPLPATADAEMLAEYYSMADVFVLPSLAENYATVSLESMACGTPVVGFDVGGIPEQLAEGRGIAVPAGNQEQFTEAVRRAIGPDSGLLRGEELAAVIRRENSVEKMTKAYLEIYRGLLEE